MHLTLLPRSSPTLLYCKAPPITVLDCIKGMPIKHDLFKILLWKCPFIMNRCSCSHEVTCIRVEVSFCANSLMRNALSLQQLSSSRIITEHKAFLGGSTMLYKSPAINYPTTLSQTKCSTVVR